MDQEDYAYYLYEDCQDCEYLAHEGHVQEDSEDVERQQGNDGCLYGLDDYLLEIVYGILESIPAFQYGKSQTEHEGEYQSRHHVHQRRNRDGEEGERFACGLDLCKRFGAYHGREYCGSCQVGAKTCKDSGSVSDEHCRQQHLAGSLSDVGYGRSYKSDDDQRYCKT